MQIQRHIILMCLCVFIMQNTKAQDNLVLNPSFEDFSTCPTINTPFLTDFWFSPNIATPNYFNACSIDMGVPSNIVGYQLARNGIGYGGIIITTSTWREYISCQTISKLKRNKKYCVSFYVSLAFKQNLPVNDSASFGVYFSDTALFFNNTLPIYLQPQIQSQYAFQAGFNDTVNWTEINGEFIANGTEQYLTIGNFSPIPILGFSNDYYFIDDVSVICCDCEEPMEEPSPANVFTPNDDNTNDVWEITNLPNNTQVHIYNRWGLEVAGTAKAKTIFKWDGRTTSGIHCTEGTYYYIISTEEKTFKGYLQLVR